MARIVLDLWFCHLYMFGLIDETMW